MYYACVHVPFEMLHSLNTAESFNEVSVNARINSAHVDNFSGRLARKNPNFDRCHKHKSE